MMLEIHPAAMLFPLMGEAELEALTKDIKSHGLLEPILLYGGAVIDGRNRLLACQNAEIEPSFRDVGHLDSPVTFAISRNLHRRHLTASQKAAIAAEMVPLLREEAKERQRAHGGTAPGRPNNTPAENGISVCGAAREVAAAAVGVGKTAVGDAMVVQQRSPELFEKIKRGEISTDKAAKTVRCGGVLPEPIESTRFADSALRKMGVVLSTIEGCCHGLADMSPRLIVSAGGEDVRVWIEKANQCAKELRAFAKKMEEVCQ